MGREDFILVPSPAARTRARQASCSAADAPAVPLRPDPVFSETDVVEYAELVIAREPEASTAYIDAIAGSGRSASTFFTSRSTEER